MPQHSKTAFKAVLFDLDGTLLDTLDDLTDTANTVLAMRGFPPRTKDEMRFFVGDGIVTLCRRILPPAEVNDKAVDELVADFRKVYAAGWKVKTRPYPGALEMLAALSGLGLALTILSNKPDAVTKLTVAHFFPETPFRFVLGEREGVPKKPDPAGAFEIAEKLGVAVSEVMYLGDTSVDMKTARAAGMHPVGALWGFRPESELVASGAAGLARTPMDVVEIAGR